MSAWSFFCLVVLAATVTFCSVLVFWQGQKIMLITSARRGSQCCSGASGATTHCIFSQFSSVLSLTPAPTRLNQTQGSTNHRPPWVGAYPQLGPTPPPANTEAPFPAVPFHQSPYFLDSVPSYFTIAYQLVSNRGNEAASWPVTER